MSRGFHINKKDLTAENIIFTTFNTLFMCFLIVVMLYPFINTLAISFNDGIDTVRGGIYLWPRMFSLQNYRVVFKLPTIGDALFNSIAKTVVQVVTNLFFTGMLSYTISRKEYRLSKIITVIFVLTMYIDAGLIPNFLLIKSLGMLNTFAVYWVPNIISAFNMIVIRTYIKTIPESLIESARIDGSSEFRIYLRIVLPLCVPVLATIALFVAVGSWNSWFDTFIYNSNPKLTVLMYEVQKLLANAQNAGASVMGGISSADQAAGMAVTPQSIRAATTIVAAIPILVVYPFLQRYFVTGLTIGGVKG